MSARRPEARHIRAVRLGHGANCSSIGSVIDTLFVSALVGGAMFAAIAAALGSETVTVVGPQARKKSPGEGDDAAPASTDESTR